MDSSEECQQEANMSQATAALEESPELTTTTPTSDTHLLVGDTVEYDEPGFGPGIEEQQGLELTESMVQATWRSVLYRHGSHVNLGSKSSWTGATVHYHRAGMEAAVIRLIDP